MKRNKPKYIQKMRLADGVISYYYNRPARLVPDGFIVKEKILGTNKWEAYAKADVINNKIEEFRKGSKTSSKKTFTYLWQEYQKTQDYRDLAPRTQKDNSYECKMIESRKTTSGTLLKDVPLDLFNKDAAKTLYGRFVEAFGQVPARRCISLLRKLYNFGRGRKIFTDVNPFEKLNIKKPTPKKITISREHIKEIISKAKEDGYNGIALACELNFYIAQRPDDIMNLKSENIAYFNGIAYFDIIQRKTTKNVKLPIPPSLLEEILEKKGYIITDPNGKYYTVNRFQIYFRKICKSLGYDYQFKNLRHTASTAFKEAGVDTGNAIKITGHTTEKTFHESYNAGDLEQSLIAMNKRIKYESFLDEKSNENDTILLLENAKSQNGAKKESK